MAEKYFEIQLAIVLPHVSSRWGEPLNIGLLMPQHGSLLIIINELHSNFF